VTNSSLFYVANSWGPDYEKDAAIYGLATVKELHRLYFTGSADDTIMINYLTTTLKKVRIAIRKYGDNIQKREFIDEIILIQDTINNIQDPAIKEKYDSFVVFLQKMEKK
jgi:hypothetical protein